MIHCSLSSTLSSVKHILQDVDRNAPNCTCKQSLSSYVALVLVRLLCIRGLFRRAKKVVHFAGISTGSAMCLVNLSFAATFRYGGKLVTDRDITLREMMT